MTNLHVCLSRICQIDMHSGNLYIHAVMFSLCDVHLHIVFLSSSSSGSPMVEKRKGRQAEFWEGLWIPIRFQYNC